MASEVQYWAGRGGWQSTAQVLRLSYDLLLEIASLLDISSLLSLRQVCRALSAITRENVLFVRLLARERGPPIAPLPPTPISPCSPEERVISAYRLHKNWDLACLPVTVRTQRAGTITAYTRHQAVAQVAPAVRQPPAAPLPYHLPPGAEAYPFLKLETYAPYREPPTKTAPSFGLAARPTSATVDPTIVDSGVHPAQLPTPAQPSFQPQPQGLEFLSLDPYVTPTTGPPLVSNFAAAAVRAWTRVPAPAPFDPVAAYPSQSGSVSGPSGAGSAPLPYPSFPTPTHALTPSVAFSRKAPTPPPAPTPRPIRVSSLPVRAIFAKIVGGGRWGVFVVKRQAKTDATGSIGAPTDNGKGKQRADGERSGGQRLTAEALASFVGSVDPKGKQKMQELNAMSEERVKNWDLDTGKSGEATPSGNTPSKSGDKAKSDEAAFLVVYDLDALAADGGSDPERGKVAEYALKGTPNSMACRGTSRGVVIVLIRGSPGTSLTTVLRWSYLASEITNLGTHKAGRVSGAISIGEFDAPGASESSQPTDGAEPGPRTLVAIVHRPRAVMIQDVDTSQRCFVKLGKMPPQELHHSIQTIHLLPGRRLLVLRSIQGEQPSYVLEEHQIPPMGETVYPEVPLQRQWIRNMEIQNASLVEGPTYDDGTPPDISLWAFATGPSRSVLHWLLRPASSSESENGSLDVELGHEHNPAEADIYAPLDSTYSFPARQVCASRLSFPHHKATLAPGARRALWFERPERSRSGEARGMRGMWGYTSVGNPDSAAQGVVRSCTSELPEDVLGAMEHNTLGIAFDEASGRVVAITCGDGYSALTGSKVWLLDYA